MKYIDTNIFIYAIENHPKYGEVCKKILENIEKKKLEAYASILVLVEIVNVLKKINEILKERKEKELDIKKNIDAILSLPIKWIELNFAIIRRASEYRYRISGIDYIHLASMELNMIHEIISADKELDKVDFIKRIEPLSLY
ncbi:MAG: type II toxin-antitoxin system VapC family toxin [Nitrososphaerota archaeon]